MLGLLCQELLVYLFCVLWKSLKYVGGLCEFHIAKREITVSVCILAVTKTRASGIGSYSLHLLKYQDF